MQNNVTVPSAIAAAAATPFTVVVAPPPPPPQPMMVSVRKDSTKPNNDFTLMILPPLWDVLKVIIPINFFKYSQCIANVNLAIRIRDAVHRGSYVAMHEHIVAP